MRGVTTSSGRQQLVLLEIQDIQDEMRRRVASRESGRSESQNVHPSG
jgi:hypothetical protein